MKKKYIFLALFFVSVLILIKIIYEDNEYDNFVCQTKKMKLREIVTYVSGRANDTRIQTNKHKKPFSIDIYKEISNNGFPRNYIEIKEGDSIIKMSNSNEFTIKRGKNIAVYQLNCDD